MRLLFLLLLMIFFSAHQTDLFQRVKKSSEEKDSTKKGEHCQTTVNRETIDLWWAKQNTAIG